LLENVAGKVQIMACRGEEIQSNYWFFKVVSLEHSVCRTRKKAEIGRERPGGI